MSDLDDLNHNQQLGNLGSIIGRAQQREIIRQNEELLDLKRKEEDLRKQEEQRKSVLPLCPDCKLLVEKDAKVCANCGLQIVTIQLSCLSSRCYAFSRKTIREDLAKKDNELQFWSEDPNILFNGMQMNPIGSMPYPEDMKDKLDAEYETETYSEWVDDWKYR